MFRRDRSAGFGGARVIKGKEEVVEEEEGGRGDGERCQDGEPVAS